MASPIVVGVRVRPFNQREARFQSQCVIGMDAGGTVKLLQMSGGKVSTTQAPREFTYDHAFWTHDRASLEDAVLCGPGVVFADQGFVYEKMATPVVDNVMSGFNACLFAYGQTGSGKTYSMMGTPSDRGVLPRLGEAMFDQILALKEGGASSSEKTLCAVEASFCEIYNEKVRDLMVAANAPPELPTGPSSGAVQPPPAPVNLAIRLDPKKGVFVEGLTKYNVTNADDFYVFLENGLASRAVGSTNMNNTSSRSHAIVILTVSQTGPRGEKCGKLCLVDLAGSERVAATGATGQTATEGQSINLSLTQLGICLKRLAEQAEASATAAGKKQAASLPIPYRDSALTFLLKENLGGNSRTAMLANISPASVNFDETLATLRFAQIARKVKSMAVVNENPQTKLILQLREELTALKARFQHLESRKSVSAAPKSNTASVDRPPPEPRQATVARSSEVRPPAAAAAELTHENDRTRSTPANSAAEVDSLLGSTLNAQMFTTGEHAPTVRADSPDLDELLHEVVQKRQQVQQPATQHERTVSADSIRLTSSDDDDDEGVASGPLSRHTAKTSDAPQSSLSLSSGKAAADDIVLDDDFDDDIIADDIEEEVRSLEALRHTTKKSFVYRPPQCQSQQSSTASFGTQPPLTLSFAPNGGVGHDTSTPGHRQHNHSMSSGGALAMSSPSFRLNLSKITSSLRPSTSNADGGGVPFPSIDHGGPLSAAGGRGHDEDLDDIMSDNTDSVISRRSLTHSSQPRFDAKELNQSFAAAALTQQQQQQPHLATSNQNNNKTASGSSNNNGVFLDARKPQLIHLNPDAVSHTDVPLALVLEEGENTFDIAGAHVVFVWDALGNQVILFGTPEAIAVNGERIEDEGTILRHRDRVVVLGALAFRFSFAAGVLALEGGFNKDPVSVDHVLLLEKYYRNQLQLERSRDAMSIAKAYVFQTASLRESLSAASLRTPPMAPPPRLQRGGDNGDDDDDSENGAPLGRYNARGHRQSVNVTRIRNNNSSSDSPIDMDDEDYAAMGSTPRGTTPRSSDPTLAAIGNDIALFNEIIYKLEVELADDYPLPEEALIAGANGAEGDGQGAEAAASYAAAIAEVERNQQDQERELEWLKAQVQHAGTRLERESTFRHNRKNNRAMPNMSIASPLDAKRRSLSHCFQSPSSTADRQLQFLDIDDAAMEHSTGDPTPASMSPTSEVAPTAAPQTQECGVETDQVVSREPPAASVEVTSSPAKENVRKARDEQAVAVEHPDELSVALALDDDAIAFEQAVSDQITTRIVQLELAYHRRVRALQQFSRLGPKPLDDKELWELLYTNPPFLGDASLQCEQSCYCLVRDHWSGLSAWTQRFVSASRSYLFVFKKADGRERCLAAVYLPGATLAKLTDTDVEVCPACPRHAKDTKTGNPKDASLVLRFRDAAEHDLWQEWFRVQVCPIPPPHHMLKRHVEERAVHLAASATSVELYGDDALSDGSPSPPQKHRRASVAIVTTSSGTAAVQHVDQLSGTANWKPDQSSTACEKCAKAFTFFRRRHHCRGCGGIFCSDCVQKSAPFGNQLACLTCREERAASPGSQKTSPRNQRKASKKQLRSTTTLTTANQAAVALDTYSAIVSSDEEVPLLDALVEDYAVYFGHDTHLSRVRVDHFQGRFHTILADDLVSVSRCPVNGSRLIIRFKHVPNNANVGNTTNLAASTMLLSTSSSYAIGAAHGAAPTAATKVVTQSLYFQSSAARESCFESLWVLLANRVFIDALDGARLPSSFAHADLVIQDESEFSLLRTTSMASSDISVWVGIESTRAIPFHHGYALYAILGFQENWSERQLDHYQLFLFTSIQLGRNKPNLYIVAHQSMRPLIQGTAITTPVTQVAGASIGGADVVVSAVGIRVLESSLVFIASNFFEFSTAVCGTAGDHGCPKIVPKYSPSKQRPSYFDPTVSMAASTSVCLQNRGADDDTAPSLPGRDDFNEYIAAKDFSLQGLQMGGGGGVLHSDASGATNRSMVEPGVDLLQWFDHAFLVGAPDMSAIGFHRKTISDSSLVQVRTTVGASVTMKKTGRTWSQFLVPALNVHASKFSFNSPAVFPQQQQQQDQQNDARHVGGVLHERPLITLRSAYLMSEDGTHEKEVTAQCELWGQQLGFDRYDHHAKAIVRDPRAGYLQKKATKRVAAVSAERGDTDALVSFMPTETEATSDTDSFLRTVVLANTLVDYLIAKCLRLTIPGVASCVVHMAAIPEGTTTEMTLEATWGGEVVGLIKASFEYQMVN